jgi:molybdopterin-guanine dinucleotide biosynthesis protein A
MYDAIIVAGGAGRRLGGADKALAVVGADRLLDRALAAVPAAGRIVVVGPPRPVEAHVLFTVEDPPGAGPAAAVAHAVRFATAGVVVVLAVDLPFAATAVPRLLARLPGHDAAMLVDATGTRQPLLAAYRTRVLKSRADEQPWANRAVRALVEPFAIADVPAVADEALDCDTADDLARAQAAARGSAR